MHVEKFYNDKLRNSKHTHNSTETIRISHINQVSEASVSQCSEWTMQGNNRTGSDKNTPRIIIHKVRRQLLTYWQEEDGRVHRSKNGVFQSMKIIKEIFGKIAI